MRHHPHYLKRRRQGLLATERRAWILDTVVLTAGILSPIFTLPQIFLIYSTHSAAGVSVVTWGVYALFDLPWILYGVVHKDRAILISYCIWFMANASVALGAIIY